MRCDLRLSGTAADREAPYARMSHRATATVLPGVDERVRLRATAARERRGQGRRDPCAAPPTRRPAAPGRQTPPRPPRPGIPRRTPARTAPVDAAATAPDRLPRHRPPLAPRLPTPPARESVPPEAARPAAHRSQHPKARPAPDPGEPKLGLPTHPRRAGRPRTHGRCFNGLGDPQGRRYRSRSRPRPPDLARVPAQPSTRDPRRRLLRNPDFDRRTPVRLRRHRTRHPPRPRHRRHHASHRDLDHTTGPQPGHGHSRRRDQGEVPHPRSGQ